MSSCGGGGGGVEGGGGGGGEGGADGLGTEGVNTRRWQTPGGAGGGIPSVGRDGKKPTRVLYWKQYGQHTPVSSAELGRSGRKEEASVTEGVSLATK